MFDIHVPGSASMEEILSGIAEEIKVIPVDQLGSTLILD
jgi:hypothetical protein